MVTNASPAKQILVLGLGISGRAALDLAMAEGCQVTGLDEKSNPELTEFQAASAQTDNLRILLDWQEEQLPKADLIVISPGIALDSRLGRLASNSVIPVISELEFGWQHCSCPILAVTGTNGKTTVTEMATHILQQLGCRVQAAGNIGYSLCAAARQSRELDYLVAEVSSFQLETCREFTPRTAVLLNISSDHINRHGNFADYAKIKFRIFNHLTPDRCILRKDLLERWQTYFPEPKDPITFAVGEAADIYSPDADQVFLNNSPTDTPLLALAETQLIGRHNLENIMAAAALILHAGLPEFDPVKLREAICIFHSGPHRLERIGVQRNISYVNDSKATNPDAMLQAVDSLADGKNICLIAGGMDKNMDFSPLRSRHDKIKHIFLVGECKEKLASCWKDVINCMLCKSFEEAVLAAVKTAEPGDVVLLSPGCASMDLFSNYQERGEAFRTIINRRVKL